MTPASKDFVTPLTLSTLSKNPVYSTFYNEEDVDAQWNNHVELGLWADLMLIAPATANTLSKMVNGNCDNLLIATYLSAKCPVYFAPAMDLVPTSELIKNIDVTFEVITSNVAPTFEIITPQIREIEVKDPEFVVAKEEEISFSFDLFATKEETVVQENTIIFELTPETRQMEVKDPINVVPVTEVNQNGIIKYSLEDYLEKEEELVASKPIEVVSEPLDEELNFTMKTSVQKFEDAAQLDNVSPLEMSIEETLKFRAEERKRKMKEFNHKFNNNAQIDEFERIPAYKRMGLDVASQPNNNSNQSRMSLGIDSNDDIQLRSNNSFLHDNVD